MKNGIITKEECNDRIPLIKVSDEYRKHDKEKPKGLLYLFIFRKKGGAWKGLEIINPLKEKINEMILNEKIDWDEAIINAEHKIGLVFV